jgi:hypothetical protein
MSDRFGTLRALLQQAPSEQVWGELCEELGLWGEEERERVALPYALGHLDRWPTQITRWAHHLDWCLRKTARGAAHEAPAWRRRLANACWVSKLEEVQALVESGDAGRLVALEVREEEEICGALRAELGAFGRLERVEVHQREGEERELEALMRARWPMSLRSLKLYPPGNISPVWGRRIAAAIAQNETLAGLEVIKLCGIQMGDAGATALAKSPHLRALRELDIFKCQIGVAGAKALADSVILDGVTRLDLDGSELGMGLAALIGSPHTRALRQLEFYSEISAPCARALVAADWPPALEELKLLDNNLSDRALATLTNAPALRLVKSYELKQRQDAAACARFLASPHLSGLERLNIEWEEGREGAAQVVEALRVGAAAQRVESLGLTGGWGDLIHALEPAWPALRGVYIGDDRRATSAQALVGLVERGALRAVERLSVDFYEGDVRELAPLWSATAHLPQLRALDLSYCQMGDEGLGVLLRGGICDQLDLIALDHNSISDQGARLLAQHPRLALFCGQAVQKGINYAPLEDNHIGDQGLRAIIHSPYIDTVTHLHLFDNPITDQGFIALAADPALARFKGELYTSIRSEEALSAMLHSPYANPWLRAYAQRRLDLIAKRGQT